MRVLKIFGIFAFGVLAIAGFTQRNTPGGENNIYAGIACGIISVLLAVSFFKRKPVHKSNAVEYDAQQNATITEQMPVYLQTSEIKQDSTLDNEYIITLFLNAYKEGSPLLDDNSYWGYIKYDCGIKHPRQLHKKLIELGYFKRIDIQTYLSTYKVTELKTVLDSMGLTKTGKKAELIERIITNLSEQEREELLAKNDYYYLSLKGKEFLDAHADYLQLKKWPDGSITVQDYDSAKTEIPFNAGFHDVLWYIYNKRQLEYCNKHSYTELILTYDQMANILIIEKRYNEAVYYILRSLYLELSGVSEYENIKDYHQKKGYSKQDLIDMYCPFLPLYSINLLKKYQEYYDDSIIDRVYKTTKTPFAITSNEDFVNFIHHIIYEKEPTEDSYQKKMRSRYRAYLKRI